MAPEQSPSTFERHPRTTMTVVMLVVFLVFLAIVEVVLRNATGLGNPTLFMESPVYGFRMQPNQERYRFGGAHFRINNLGLRADTDWNDDISGRVLFFGDSVTYGGNHIGNEQLFSTAAVSNLPDLESGNGGVPGWGVENVHALAVRDGFIPAETIVTTFIEHDFYRGLQDGKNKPYVWFESPRFALRELAVIAWVRLEIKLGLRHREYGDKNAQRAAERAAAERAAVKLREMDDYVKSMGRNHLIYISPMRAQVLGEAGPDTLVARLVRQHDIDARYLIDRLDIDGTSREERNSWFRDSCHLTPEGHSLWGSLIEEDLRRLLPEAT